MLAVTFAQWLVEGIAYTADVRYLSTQTLERLSLHPLTFPQRRVTRNYRRGRSQCCAHPENSIHKSCESCHLRWVRKQMENNTLLHRIIES